MKKLSLPKPTIPEKHEKAWGLELWIANTPLYCGKRMYLQPGWSSSYHKHKQKTETFFVERGSLAMNVEGKLMLLSTGDAITIPPGAWHSFSFPMSWRGWCPVTSEVIFFEFSTQHSEDDVVRKDKSHRLSVSEERRLRKLLPL